jgi:hypothetical protein
MQVRTVILVVALVFIALFAYLTLRVLITHGPDPLSALSLLVLALLGFGIVGALRNPPPE